MANSLAHGHCVCTWASYLIREVSSIYESIDIKAVKGLETAPRERMTVRGHSSTHLILKTAATVCFPFFLEHCIILHTSSYVCFSDSKCHVFCAAKRVHFATWLRTVPPIFFTSYC